MMQATTAPPNRMAKRRQRTRLQLLSAAEQVVLQHGYEQASAEAIAELADLGRSTFYNHFDNKSDVVLATLTARLREYGEKAYVPLDEISDRAVSVVRSTLQVFRDMASDPLTQQLVGRPLLLARAIAESQGEFAARDFSEGVTQGRFKVAVSEESLLSSLNWSYVGMIIHAISQDSIEQSSLDFSQLMLLQLGIEQGEIESIIKSAKKS